MLTALVSLVGYRWTLYIIPKLEPRHVKAGLVGKDINKKGTEAGDRPVPESLGLAPGVVCLACLAVIQLIHTGRVVPRLCSMMDLGDCEDRDSEAWMDDFPAALASIALMLMLGFVDDVLDLPWRVKLVMPLVAALPLLAAYSGSTAVGIPSPIVEYLNLKQTWLELGPLYYVYMAMLVIFCTNSINILAGVNGLEVGQSYIISVAILTFNILRLTWSTGPYLPSLGLCHTHCGWPAAQCCLHGCPVSAPVTYWFCLCRICVELFGSLQRLHHDANSGDIVCPTLLQLVSESGVCWRHLYLLRRHDYSCCGNFGPLQPDFAYLPYPASIQFRVFYSPAVRDCVLPAPQAAYI